MTRIAGMMSVIVRPTQLEPCVKSRIVPKVLLSKAINTSELSIKDATGEQNITVKSFMKKN